MFESNIIIPLYVAIFILSVGGNSLVLATLARHKRMRTVTNVYLLNLAVSDLLLGVFCMPFTLVGQVLRNFIFGAVMCKLIPYFQAVCVSVGVWTLVAISLERYFAICRPLKSRRWQTQFHAFKVIVCVWISSFIWTSPIVAFSKLKAIKEGRHKCREEWPNLTTERAFNLFVDVILLLVPLIVMILAYSLIVHKLWKGLRSEIKHSSARKQGRYSTVKTAINEILIEKEEGDSTFEECEESRERIAFCKPPSKKPPANKQGNQSFKRSSKNRPRVRLWLKNVRRRDPWENDQPRNNHLITSMLLSEMTPCSSYNSSNEECNREEKKEETFEFENTSSYTFSRQAIRSNYMDKSIEAKKKVIRMLFILVIEFFVCWAPLHVLNTWYLFSPEVIYKYVGSTGVSLVQLLAYISSCCNPITYCFMNKKFRQAFLNVFHRYRRKRGCSIKGTTLTDAFKLGVYEVK